MIRGRFAERSGARPRPFSIHTQEFRLLRFNTDIKVGRRDLFSSYQYRSMGGGDFRHFAVCSHFQWSVNNTRPRDG